MEITISRPDVDGRRHVALDGIFSGTVTRYETMSGDVEWSVLMDDGRGFDTDRFSDIRDWIRDAFTAAA